MFTSLIVKCFFTERCINTSIYWSVDYTILKWSKPWKARFLKGLQAIHFAFTLFYISIYRAWPYILIWGYAPTKNYTNLHTLVLTVFLKTNFLWRASMAIAIAISNYIFYFNKFRNIKSKAPQGGKYLLVFRWKGYLLFML